MKLITALTFALALTAPAIAQIVTGTVTGHVSDPSGAAVVQGSIELRKSSTGRVRTTVTDALGEFVLGGLDPGDYTLSISQKGFKKYLRSDVHVDAGDRVVLGDVIDLEQRCHGAHPFLVPDWQSDGTHRRAYSQQSPGRGVILLTVNR